MLPARVAVVILAGAFAATGPGSGSSAVANSDPASHVLPVQDIFLPSAQPPWGRWWEKQPAETLAAAVDRVYNRGHRIKVAVIANPVELGGLASLWNHPPRYARRLGEVIRPVFVGPLLVVMPAGFGIYDGGRSTAAQRRVLARVDLDGTTPDALTASGATAVNRLLVAGALRSKDVLRPRAAPYPSTGRRGAVMKLYYTAQDDSDRVRVMLSVNAGRQRLATFRLPLRRLRRRLESSIDWRVPKQPARGDLRFCVGARDASGNTSPTTCATLSIT